MDAEAKKSAIPYVLVAFLCALTLSAHSADRGRINGIALNQRVEKATRESSATLLESAEKYAAEGNFQDALALYAIVYNRIDNSMNDNEKENCIKARLKAGQIFYNQGSYHNALDQFVIGVKLSEEHDIPEYAARMWNNIGNIYCIFLDTGKGIDCYNKAMAICNKYPDRKTKHDIAVNLTGIYCKRGEYDKAKKYFAIAGKTMERNNPVNEYMQQFTECLIMFGENRHKDAVARLKKLAAYSQEKSLEPKYLCFAFQEISNGYQYLNQPDSAIRYLKLCCETAAEHNVLHTFDFTLKELSDFYEQKGNIDMANKYRAKYISIKDSVYNMRDFDAIKNSLFTYEVNKTSREIKDLQQSERDKARTIRTQRLIMLVSVSVIAMICTFLFIVLRQKRQLRRSYMNLYKVNNDFIESQKGLTSRLRELKVQYEADTRKPDSGDTGVPDESTDTEASRTNTRYRTSSLAEKEKLKIADAIRDIMENTLEFCNPDFSLDTVASLIGSNRTYVSQVINDVFKKSFNEYINPYRIHQACSLFRDTQNYGHYTMKAIAECVGYKSYTSFVNSFKKVTGITPSLYQKMTRSEHKDVNGDRSGAHDSLR